MGCERLREQYGIDDPKLVIDILALWGDAADNIPGVPGIGEKTAVKLVNEFGPVESILANLDRLKGKQKENLTAGRDQLLLSKRLATIETDAPVPFDPQALAVEDPDCDALRALYTELDFGMFLREMDGTSAVPQTGGCPVQAAGCRPAYEKRFRRPPPCSAICSVPPPKRPLPRRKRCSSTPRPAVTTRSADTPHTYTTIDTPEALHALADRLSRCRGVLLRHRDFGHRLPHQPHRGHFVCADREGKPAMCPLPRGDPDGVLEALRPALENERIAKIGQNIKFDIMALAVAGIRGGGIQVRHDDPPLPARPRIAPRHEPPGPGYYLDYSPIEIETLIGRGSRQLTMDKVPLAAISEYGAEDSDVTLRLRNVLWPLIEQQGFTDLYPPDRGAADRRAGRHRTDRREDRHSPAGRLRPRADRPHGRH